LKYSESNQGKKNTGLLALCFFLHYFLKVYYKGNIDLSKEDAMFRSKRAFALIVLCAVLLIGLPRILHAATETEFNNDMAHADQLSSGESTAGQLSSCSDVDWFSVTTTGPDTLAINTINFIPAEVDYIIYCYGDYLKITVYDVYGAKMMNNPLVNIVGLKCGMDFSVDVTAAGTYYIVIAPDQKYSTCPSGVTKPYTLTVTGNAIITTTSTTTTPGGSSTTIVPATTTTIPAETIKVDFVGSPTYGQVPLLVNFTSFSTDNVSKYEWDFGDKETSTEKNPSHLYSMEGTYSVSLRGSGNGQADDEVKTGYITVKRTVLTTTSTVLPTTTTVPAFCPFNAYIGNYEATETIRTLRDQIVTAPSGLLLISLYYKNVFEISAILVHNYELRNRFQQLVVDKLWIAKQLVNGHKVAIAQETMNDTVLFLNMVKEQGSPALQNDIDLVVSILNNDSLQKEIGILTIR
jgi:PKD repeat protein